MRQAHSILDRRRAGVLLHVTSLPGPFPEGDLGPSAYRFVDQLVALGMTVWQTLPINPTHGDGSPYQCLSAHAGNPRLIDLDALVGRGWLDAASVPSEPSAETPSRLRLLERAFRAFAAEGGLESSPFHDFRVTHAHWLDDFSLFMALRGQAGGSAWQDWPEALRQRDPAALLRARAELRPEIDQVAFEQYVFFEQWQALRTYANQRGILLFGDVPIFVAGDSAEVWADPSAFDLLPSGHPRVVAGVPPDYFSATGQRWGNPHYRWAEMEADGFRWWRARFKTQFALYDWVRIDHFRGFEAYWEIPGEAETAMDGHWVKAPGAALLDALFSDSETGSLPLVAEDLGIITPEVEALRDAFEIPGMKILQFAFEGGADNPYLPCHHPENSVVYTGTHDNDTTRGWFEGLSEGLRAHVYAVLGNPDLPMPDALIRAALESKARLAMIPMQDVLGLGQGSRMNTPGTTEGNWGWRLEKEALSASRIETLKDWVVASGRSTPAAAGY